MKTQRQINALQSLRRSISTKKKNILYGPATELCMYVTQRKEILPPEGTCFCSAKIADVFAKHQFRRDANGMIRIHRKRLDSLILRNISKLCIPRSEA